MRLRALTAQSNITLEDANMPVYVDGERNGFGRMVMCHMVADTPEELHAMAASIGMKREWYQSPEKVSFPHYDLSLSRRALAIKNGAKEISRQELVTFMKAIKQPLLAARRTWRETAWW
jgi:hypothetical protein